MREGSSVRLQSSELEAKAYVRSSLLLDPIDSKVETLQREVEAGGLKSLEIHAWPAGIALSEMTPFTDVLEEFKAFDSWAAHTGVSISPPFQVRDRSDLGTDAPQTVLTTPVMCLAIYADGDLIHVFPHTDGDTHYSVTDAIAAIRSGELTGKPAPEGPAVYPSICPECGEQTVNVQGIGVCQSCGWSGVGSDTESARRPQTDVDRLVEPDLGKTE